VGEHDLFVQAAVVGRVPADPIPLTARRVHPDRRHASEEGEVYSRKEGPLPRTNTVSVIAQVRS
jgi:hypothetical protein